MSHFWWEEKLQRQVSFEDVVCVSADELLHACVDDLCFDLFELLSILDLTCFPFFVIRMSTR